MRPYRRVRLLTTIACLAAPITCFTATARPTGLSVTTTQTGRVQRSRDVFSQQGQLPYPWEQLFDQNSGQVYYSNPQTGVAQWDPPPQWEYPNRGKNELKSMLPLTLDALQGQNGFSKLRGPVCWRLAGFSGVTEYSGGGILKRKEDELPYKLRIGDERVLSRWNMEKQKLTVSRIQGIVNVLADGTATITSKGRGPTLYRAGYGAPWYALQKDETQILADGDQVSLDCNDPEAAIFTCQQESTVQNYLHNLFSSAEQRGGEQQGQQGQPQHAYEQPQLPYPWEQLFDQSSGHVYYANLETGVAQWEPPL